MQISEKHREEIEQIIAGFECPKDFVCYKSGFENLCKAKDANIEGFTYCLGEARRTELCPFSLSFGYRYLCKCPLRVYLIKNLNI